MRKVLAYKCTQLKTLAYVGCFYAWIKQETITEGKMKVEQFIPCQNLFLAETISNILASYMANSDDKTLMLRNTVKISGQINVKYHPSPKIENGELWKWKPFGDYLPRSTWNLLHQQYLKSVQEAQERGS